MRRHLAAPVVVAGLLAAGGASASPSYPAALTSDLGALVRRRGVTSVTTRPPRLVGVVDTPFGRSMVARGLLGNDDDASVATALARMRADGVDSDGDGAEDLDELWWKGDPNHASLPNRRRGRCLPSTAARRRRRLAGGLPGEHGPFALLAGLASIPAARVDQRSSPRPGAARVMRRSPLLVALAVAGSPCRRWHAPLERRAPRASPASRSRCPPIASTPTSRRAPRCSPATPKLSRGPMTLSCPRVDLRYDHVPHVTWARGSGGVAAEIKGVHAEAPDVELDLGAHTLELRGGVRLTRGDGWITAERASIDIATAKVTHERREGLDPDPRSPRRERSARSRRRPGRRGRHREARRCRRAPRGQPRGRHGRGAGHLRAQRRRQEHALPRADGRGALAGGRAAARRHGRDRRGRCGKGPAVAWAMCRRPPASSSILTALENLAVFQAPPRRAAAPVGGLARELAAVELLTEPSASPAGPTCEPAHSPAASGGGSSSAGPSPRSPRVLLCDEPFAAIDPHGAERAGARLRALADAGGAVLIADHHVAEALRPVRSGGPPPRRRDRARGPACRVLRRSSRPPALRRRHPSPGRDG